ncbi:MAG: GNAT family N-acetyltransferase [Cellulomonadaceae bacterium]|jgi:RimJ/RimL family protein N-acetyltransferase|nr:GNAT family N-acetyltransferase [Cellulomonadaceae bacterium]
MEPFVLANDRVRLTPATESDVDAITAWCQDDEVRQWTTIPWPYEREHSEYYVETVIPDGWHSEKDYTWIIRDAAAYTEGGPEPVALGTMTLRPDNADEGLQSGEIAFAVAPEARGKGFATAAALLALEWGFSPEGLNLARATWRAALGNWWSRRVAWKCGFQVEAVIRAEVPMRGQRGDGWLATLLPNDPRQPNEDWPADAPWPGTGEAA